MNSYICPQHKTRDFTIVLTLRDTSSATPTAIKVATNPELFTITTVDNVISITAIGEVGRTASIYYICTYVVDSVQYKAFESFFLTITPP